MSYILAIWTIVGYAGTQFSTHTKYDWRPIGEFGSVQLCEEAARQLAIEYKAYRCVRAR